MAAQSSARGAYAPGRARQVKILEAAAEVFSTRGFRGGSLRDIAEKAEITPAAILHHFTSKEALLFAVLDQRDLAGTSTPSGVELFSGDYIGYLRQIVADNVHDRTGVRLYATIAAEATADQHPAHEYFSQRYRVLTAIMTERFAATGLTPPGADSGVLARNILAVMDGIQTQWLFDETFDMEAAFDAFLVQTGMLPK